MNTKTTPKSTTVTVHVKATLADDLNLGQLGDAEVALAAAGLVKDDLGWHGNVTPTRLRTMEKSGVFKGVATFTTDAPTSVVVETVNEPKQHLIVAKFFKQSGGKSPSQEARAKSLRELGFISNKALGGYVKQGTLQECANLRTADWRGVVFELAKPVTNSDGSPAIVEDVGSPDAPLAPPHLLEGVLDSGLGRPSPTVNQFEPPTAASETAPVDELTAAMAMMPKLPDPVPVEPKAAKEPKAPKAPREPRAPRASKTVATLDAKLAEMVGALIGEHGIAAVTAAVAARLGTTDRLLIRYAGITANRAAALANG